MDINAKGVFLGCKYGIPALRRAGGGSIINTASFVALHGRRDAADRLHGEQRRRALHDPRAGRDPRAREHPRQRAVSGPAQDRAADELPRHRGEEATAPGPHPDGPLRRSARRSRRPRSSSPPTSPPTSPAPSSWSTAASPRPTSRRNERDGTHSDAISPVDGSVYVERDARVRHATSRPRLRARRAAQRAWTARPGRGARGHCRRMVAWCLERADTLGEELTRQMGRPIAAVAE